MKYTSTYFFLSILLVSSSFAQSPQAGDFQGYTSSLYVGAETMRYASQIAEQFLHEGSGLSGAVGRSDLDYDNYGVREVEGEFDTSYVSVGYAYQFDAFSLGAAVTRVDADTDSSGTTNPLVQHEMDADGFLATLAASTESPGFFIGVQASFGEFSFDSSRVNGFNFPKEGDFDVSTFQVELSAFYELATSEAFSLTPYAKIGLVDLDADGFEETTAGADDAEFDSFDDNYTYGEIGLKFRLLSMGDLVPYAQLSVWQDFGDDEIEVTGFDAAGNRFEGGSTLEDPDIAGTVIRGVLGFDWVVTEAISLGASVAYEDGDAYDGYRALLNFNWAL